MYLYTPKTPNGRWELESKAAGEGVWGVGWGGVHPRGVDYTMSERDGRTVAVQVH